MHPSSCFAELAMRRTAEYGPDFIAMLGCEYTGEGGLGPVRWIAEVQIRVCPQSLGRVSISQPNLLCRIVLLDKSDKALLSQVPRKAMDESQR